MKQNLDNAGVAALQDYALALLTLANDSQSAQTYAHPLMIRIRYNYK